MINYEKLIKEKDEELKRIVKQFNDEVAQLYTEWSQALAEKNVEHNQKIDKYLETVSKHTLVRNDMKKSRVYRKIVPFCRVFNTVGKVRYYAIVTWRNDSEKIEIDFKKIEEKEVDSQYLKKLKFRVAPVHVEWKSVKISPELEEGFTEMREVLNEHFQPEMGKNETELLKTWLKSLVSKNISETAKVTSAANRFGI